MSEKEVRKTTTKKPVRKAAPKKAVSKAAPVKKPVKKTVVRKAPTPVAATKKTEKRSARLIIVGSIVFIAIVGGSVVLGVSGSGEINIDSRISELREQATPEERTKINSIPVQKTHLPDGGLVPSGVPKTVPPPKPIATTTDEIATSSSAVSTSTTETADDAQTEEDTKGTVPEEVTEPTAPQGSVEPDVVP